MVDIVQLVERQIVDLVVVGSSPSIHPTTSQLGIFVGLHFLQPLTFSRLLLSLQKRTSLTFLKNNSFLFLRVLNPERANNLVGLFLFVY